MKEPYQVPHLGPLGIVELDEVGALQGPKVPLGAPLGPLLLGPVDPVVLVQPALVGRRRVHRTPLHVPMLEVVVPVQNLRGGKREIEIWLDLPVELKFS